MKLLLCNETHLIQSHCISLYSCLLPTYSKRTSKVQITVCIYGYQADVLREERKVRDFSESKHLPLKSWMKSRLVDSDVEHSQWKKSKDN